MPDNRWKFVTFGHGGTWQTTARVGELSHNIVTVLPIRRDYMSSMFLEYTVQRKMGAMGLVDKPKVSYKRLLRILIGTMRIRLAFISLYIALLGCAPATSLSEISAFEYSTIGYGANSMGKLVKLRNSVKIYYYKDFVIYEFPILREKPHKEDNRILSKDEALDYSLNEDNFIKVSRYMVVKDGDTTALQYDMRPDTITTVVNLNTRLKLHTISPQQLEDLGNGGGSPISVVRDDKGKVIKEVFATNNPDPTAADTVARYFDEKLTGAKFTFSKKQDEEKKSKFWKCEWIINPYPYTREDGTVVTIPRTSTIWQFEKIAAPSMQLIDNLIGRFKKEMPKKQD